MGHYTELKQVLLIFVHGKRIYSCEGTEYSRVTVCCLYCDVQVRVGFAKFISASRTFKLSRVCRQRGAGGTPYCAERLSVVHVYMNKVLSNCSLCNCPDCIQESGDRLTVFLMPGYSDMQGVA